MSAAVLRLLVIAFAIIMTATLTNTTPLYSFISYGISIYCSILMHVWKLALLTFNNILTFTSHCDWRLSFFPSFIIIISIFFDWANWF